MRRFWLIFAEFVTITLALVFVVTLIRPDWNPWRRNVVEIRESVSAAGGLLAAATQGTVKPSYAEASKRAMASVVNISSSRDLNTSSNHLLANDPLFQRFFGQPNGDEAFEQVKQQRQRFFQPPPIIPPRTMARRDVPNLRRDQA